MGQVQLKRDLDREALTRIEEAARTDKEFKGVVRWWNRLDANRERRERYHEHLYNENSLDVEEVHPELNSPKLSCNDDFIDILSMCPCKMHNILEDNDISLLIQKATDKQKAVFFPRILLCCSTKRISFCHEMTDRNVRSRIDLMLDNIREEMFEMLKKRDENGMTLTFNERQFLSEYTPPEKKIKEQAPKKKNKKQPIDETVNKL